jgi:uncharacterized membrane protein
MSAVFQVPRGRTDPGLSPPGWSYNPSSWSERVPLIGVALAGFVVASYLTLYQLGLIDRVWEPFFGGGSATVLHSPVSRALPIPDASLGALGYALDAVTGGVGGTDRWRSRPWIVILFGIATGPLGAVSVMLVIFQPLLYHAWCTLCLASAVASVAMIGPAMDEVLASLQYLTRVRCEGGSVWGAFWHGDRS